MFQTTVITSSASQRSNAIRSQAQLCHSLLRAL